MGRSIKRASFAATVSRPDRRVSGRSWAPKTPLAVRTSGVDVDPALRQRVRQRLGERLGKLAPHIQRVSVRFEDVNGPRGGVDVSCRIKGVVTGLPSLVVTELANSPVEAFDRAGQRFQRVVKRTIGRARERRQLGRVARPPRPAQGSRAGRSTDAAAPSNAVRNRKARAPKATAALEGSAQARPSRKSTRGSANRAKQGNKLARRERRRATSQNARRAQAPTP